MQILIENAQVHDQAMLKQLSTGSSVQVYGQVVASPAKGQAVELQAESIQMIGWADPAQYPLQKKRHTFEFLRALPQLRARTNALGAVARVRSNLSYAIHRFFHERGFLQVHTPIITTSDCEGAGEMFTVTSLERAALQGAQPFSQDFFGKRAGLTVSGQLQAEIYALSHGLGLYLWPNFSGGKLKHR
jgi:asparaginyl-tRNA synthetase